MSGWVKYHITDKSGCGFKEPHWFYAPNFKEDDAKEHILYNLEQWALTADSYSLTIELDQDAPADVIHKEISLMQRSLNGMKSTLNKLYDSVRDSDATVQRRVVCSANRHTDKDGKVWTVYGPRHWGPEMRETAKLLPFDAHDNIEWDQGFIDQRGVFMHRQEAWKVAEAAGQIRYRRGGDTIDGGYLFSENLY